MPYGKCKDHGVVYCYQTKCRRAREEAKASNNDNSGEIGINSEGHTTIGLGSGMTVDTKDGSIGFSTGGGFSVDT